MGQSVLSSVLAALYELLQLSVLSTQFLCPDALAHILRVHCNQQYIVVNIGIISTAQNIPYLRIQLLAALQVFLLSIYCKDLQLPNEKEKELVQQRG